MDIVKVIKIIEYADFYQRILELKEDILLRI